MLDVTLDNAEDTVKLLKKDYAEPANRTFASFQTDVSRKEDVWRTMDRIMERFSRAPNIAVNAAGITIDRMLLQMQESDFDRVIDVNLKGTWLVTQSVARLMIDQDVANGSIVNISSVVGKMGNIGQTNYAASKAGVVAMTKSAAQELAKHKIRCNVIVPGFVISPMTATIPEKIKERFIQLIPSRRFGEPHEVAEAITFLASDKSSYMTGSTIEVTGGMAM